MIILAMQLYAAQAEAKKRGVPTWHFFSDDHIRQHIAWNDADAEYWPTIGMHGYAKQAVENAAAQRQYLRDVRGVQP